MSQPLPIALEDGWYHVINRGIERRSIFRSATDYRHFGELLAELPERFGILIHCYALMPNHYHLLVQTPKANLSQTIQWLNVSYSGLLRAMFRAARLRAGFAPEVCSASLPVRPASGVNALSSVLLSNQSGREHSILFSTESWRAWLRAAGSSGTKLLKLARGGATHRAAVQKRAFRLDWPLLQQRVAELKAEPWSAFAERRNDEARDLALYVARRFGGLHLDRVG